MATITGRVDTLVDALHSAPKTLRWKARAAVGTRVPWYATPEEVQRG